MGSSTLKVSQVAGGVQAYTADQVADIVAASASARGVRLTNLGGSGAGEYVTYAVDADATGASTERRLYVGQPITIADGALFKLRVSIKAALPTSIQWETWG